MNARLGLLSIFGSPFFELVGHFMLMPLLLLRLKGADVSTTVAGLFAATGWLGIFLMTPFASAVAHRVGRRPAMWVVIAFSAAGLLWTAFIPKLPPAADADTARLGLGGLWHTLRLHPIIMLAGFVGGFFETGVTSNLPLYGLALGLSTSAAALLVSASGLGGVVASGASGALID